MYNKWSEKLKLTFFSYPRKYGFFKIQRLFPHKIENWKIAENCFLVFKSSLLMWIFFPYTAVIWSRFMCENSNFWKLRIFFPFLPLKLKNSKIAQSDFQYSTLLSSCEILFDWSSLEQSYIWKSDFSKIYQFPLFKSKIPKPPQKIFSIRVLSPHVRILCH